MHIVKKVFLLIETLNIKEHENSNQIYISSLIKKIINMEKY